MNQTINLDDTRNRKIKDVVGANLTGVNFSGVNLVEVNLSKASLQGGIYKELMSLMPTVVMLTCEEQFS
ncbi:MAG: pentapeptide repeat-containing protein [cyanobacterium endosymbiont of Rhopalodia musculus]|uniref:pentapeptide repeat-containing protein n=1 Tax=cyanobacterium endosymbiont of Epithemia clementina EcSB TaxID=3034674 RepID=UPI00248174E5|nr:pentapeptide repeat-containing protein [cyanobacterium endosymbiont of Epithemia clementina EcSB]WGT66717.1 pentapeptide repeat-containing protein [cyanobacterium endosymbiont of Epithemia clementina EcSB]